ncbi:hypothetical protein GQR60_17125 [Labilibaculum sp. A4]|uniref:hypothetical protein n=1 Tax=Labilibaculum TaxID=2060722 RepID=UPI000F6266D4|nr:MULTISPECIES: hypothetical protein [Labilibaculum]MDM8161342.1 hypothetical protein [Labilibaculum sp. K2S]MDQ1772355.1 hypothetical protein [Labilibaculum euxinus]MWN78059.1 hypothetical protein [Labilibaculum euxinus]
MGTSQAYSGFSKNPNWGPLSDSITRACDDGKISTEKLAKITSRFVNLLGGSNIAGRGGSKIGGKSGIRTAQKIGGFFGDISTVGFSQALVNSGFDYDGSQSPNDLINHLLEYCAGVAATIDDTAAKEAERQLLCEILAEAKDFQELERNFQEKIEEYGIEELMVKYYALYIYEHLSIDFYEKLIKDKGKSKCGNLYRQLKDFLFEKVKNISRNSDLSKIQWNGEEGDRMVKNIFEDTLKAFEGYEN